MRAPLLVCGLCFALQPFVLADAAVAALGLHRHLRVRRQRSDDGAPAATVDNPGRSDTPPVPGEPLSSQVDGSWRQDDGQADVLNCTCSACKGGRLRDDSRPGFQGYQCRPDADGVARRRCTQEGTPDQWVVQTAQELPYDRFCMFTCKPLLPKQITPDIPCGPLDPWQTAQAQTPSGNGREFVFRGNPMTDTPPWPSFAAEAFKFKDPFGLPGGGTTATEAPPVPTGEPQCNCTCADVRYTYSEQEATPAADPGLPYPTPPPPPPPPPALPPPPPPPPPLPPPPPPGPPPVPPLPFFPAAMAERPEDFPAILPLPQPTLQPTPGPRLKTGTRASMLLMGQPDESDWGMTEQAPVHDASAVLLQQASSPMRFVRPAVPADLRAAKADSGCDCSARCAPERERMRALWEAQAEGLREIRASRAEAEAEEEEEDAEDAGASPTEG